MARKISYQQAINEALAQEMRRDSTVFIIGEDVAGGAGAPGDNDAWGGVLGVTKGLYHQFPGRVLDTPLSEIGYVGAATSEQFKATKAWKYLTPYTKQMAEQTTKGKIYGIGNGYYTKASFVRTDRFKAAGIAVPKTWQDVYNAKSMQKDNQYVYAMRGAAAAHSQAMFIIHAHLAPNLNATGLQTKDGKTIFATPEAQTAMDLLLKIWKEAAPAASIAWGYPEMVKGFHTGVANYLIQDNEVIQIVEENFEPYSKGNWIMTQIPKGPTGYSAQFIGAGGAWIRSRYRAGCLVGLAQANGRPM